MILSRYGFRMLARLLYACSVERPENKFSNDLFHCSVAIHSVQVENLFDASTGVVG